MTFGKPAITSREVKIVQGDSTASLYHRIKVSGLEPGKRYYYRLYDPGATPTPEEVNWGAAKPWSREFAVSTEAPLGKKTIIHLPVKVLLIPNVINVASAVQADGSIAPEPPKITPEQLALIENEFKNSARIFWVNSGMRLWVDYKFYVDDRLQRWGPEAPATTSFYRNLPLSRAYAGVDFAAPGGGAFTILDTKNVTQSNDKPIVESRPFPSQIEMAWPRKWNQTSKKWEFYNSGGGTYGIDSYFRGIPGRSQFLAGGDTAWLASHEFHHQMESIGQVSFGKDENDRIVFDHPSPRHRTRKGDGTFDDQAWTSAGDHGEHWDILRYWDRRTTDAQWLRLYFGDTITVADKDEDGFPDNDPRLPLDEKRFGSSAALASTDGTLGDLAKAMTSDWVTGPLQNSWTKPSNVIVPVAKAPVVVDEDGLAIKAQPTPIIERRITVDGKDADWAGVPVSASINNDSLKLTFQQTYDANAYYGLVTVKGPMEHIDVDLDGEGLGIYSGPAALGFSVRNIRGQAGQSGPVVLPVSVTPTAGGVGNRTPWLKWSASSSNGTIIFEFSVANRVDSPWYWTDAGHAIGFSINAFDSTGRGYSRGIPYHLTFSRMMEGRGVASIPSGAPAPLADADAVTVHPTDKGIVLGDGWSAEGSGWKHNGDVSSITVPIPRTLQFDVRTMVSGNGYVFFGADSSGNESFRCRS